jgi:hypothetical protein
MPANDVTAFDPIVRWHCDGNILQLGVKYRTGVAVPDFRGYDNIE